MPLNPHRLRYWFAVAIAMLVLVVAGFYARGYYARYLLARVVQHKAEKLGINIQQSTQGFSLSKSEGGRTLFTIRASKAVQTTSGVAQLNEVNIVVYGREGNRFDQIYGSQFEYNPKTGNVTAQGEVHIDLQGVAAGDVQPDLAPPKEMKNPIHLKTSGLVFNRNSGIAETNQLVEFRVPQVSGSAVGVTYDSKANRAVFHSDIKLDSSGPNAGKLTASHGEITKDPSRILLANAHVERQGGNIAAEQLTVFLRPDQTIERVLANGNVTAETRGKTEARVEAPHAEATVNADDDIQTASLSGGVNITTAGDQPMHGTAGQVVLDFGADNQLQTLHALDKVNLVQEPAKDKPRSQAVKLVSDAVDFKVKHGVGLQLAETVGPAQVEIVSGDPPSASAKQSGNNQTSTVATATRFIANFDKRGHISTVTGSPNAKIVSTSPGQPERVTTSDLLTLTMDPKGGLARVVQDGNFHFLEPPDKTGDPETEAFAQNAVYSPSDENFVLTGNPRITNAGATTTADTIKLNRRTGDGAAAGSVKTTYSQIQQQPNGALLATGEPIHVTAASMTAHRASETARYSGGARLWQGSNIVEAPAIDFDRVHLSMVAHGSASKPVSTVFIEGQNGKQTPVSVTGTQLTYADAQREAKFTGGVILRDADGTVTADHVTVHLLPRGNQKSEPLSGASQIERIVAEGNVVIQQGDRRGVGSRLVYLAKDASFTLTGGSPSIFDAEHGKVTGDSLTFFSRDDRVLVEGGKAAPTVTKARVVK